MSLNQDLIKKIKTYGGARYDEGEADGSPTGSGSRFGEQADQLLAEIIATLETHQLVPSPPPSAG